MSDISYYSTLFRNVIWLTKKRQKGCVAVPPTFFGKVSGNVVGCGQKWLVCRQAERTGFFERGLDG